MKLLLSLALVCSVNAFSQPDNYAKEEVVGTHYVLSRSKKDVGIYSKARGNFISPPHKGYLFHFEHAQLILDIYPKTKEGKVKVLKEDLTYDALTEKYKGLVD